MSSTAIAIGTRGSALALAQAELVCRALRAARPDVVLHVKAIRTTGDVRCDVPLSQMGRFGVFVGEIEEALLDGMIDIAVHSAKDMPSAVVRGTLVAGYLPRASACDVLVARGVTLGSLPPGSRVGTSSARRMCLVRALRPDVLAVDIRGNVDTRLERLQAGAYDALILAAAGLTRLGRENSISEWLDPHDFVPSPGQGALALQVRVNDALTTDLVHCVNDRDTACAVGAERAFLAQSGAGCGSAVGAYAQLTPHGTLSLVGLLGDARGRFVRQTMTAPRHAAQDVGAALARCVAQRAANEGIEYHRAEVSLADRS